MVRRPRVDFFEVQRVEEVDNEHQQSFFRETPEKADAEDSKRFPGMGVQVAGAWQRYSPGERERHCRSREGR